jgi:hypothetical protein
MEYRSEMYEDPATISTLQRQLQAVPLEVGTFCDPSNYF